MKRLKFFLVLLLFLYNAIPVLSYELILPKEKNSIVNTDYVIFSGRAKNSETITINNEHIFIAPNGAFTHTIRLKDGENRILIRSNYSTQVYKLRKKNLPDKQAEEFQAFDKYSVSVKADNTPLRSTPVDAGLNRIAHLFKDTTVVIDGEKGDFYRVYLSEKQNAWIAKKDVQRCPYDNNIGEFISMDSKKYKNAVVQTISFSKNLPYTIDILNKEILFKIYNPEFSDSSVYTVNIPKPEKYVYSVDLKDGKYTFKVSELPDISDLVVAVDAGHGGTEKGAIGCLGDSEKDINLRIALELQKQLKENGINVVMTRECDGNVSLNDRVAIAKEHDADIFISIHLNSIGDVSFNSYKHKGTSVYYFNPNSKELAEVLERKITKQAGTRKDGVKTGSFAVIRPANYVGVLVEAAYMINPHDTMLYMEKEFAKNVAKGIVDAILEYIEQ